MILLILSRLVHL